MVEISGLSDKILGVSISMDKEIEVGYVFLADECFALPIDAMLFSTPRPTPTPQRIPRIKMCRGNVFQDLNAAIQDVGVSEEDTILEREIILPSGTTEKGEAHGGVLRDALSEYWETFMRKCTSGTMKIPMT